MKIVVPDDCTNAPRKEFIRDFTIAFAKNDTEDILERMTEDIVWNLVGSKILEGKEQVLKMLKTMGGEEAKELIVDTIVAHGDTAAANGIMEFEKKAIAFCDIYRFTGHDSNTKIQELTSYGIELK